MTLVSSNDAHHPKLKKAKLAEDLCLAAVSACARVHVPAFLALAPRARHHPLNSVHRTVMMAIERVISTTWLFDNRVLWNHRALAAVLGVILRLPPVKQVLATKQVKSQYLEYLIQRVEI